MMAERGWNPNIEISPNCPRCGSCNTKFCYYNNYSLTQPRYFCKSCKRYWTKGGSLRNVPVGGGCRKSRKSKSTRLSTSCVTSRIYPKTQDSATFTTSIDIAQVYANYLNQQPSDTEAINKVFTPQPTYDAYFDQFSSAAPSHMGMDFNSYFPLQMGYEAFHCTNIDNLVNDLPPLPGEGGGLPVSTTSRENDIIFQNSPELASIELGVPHSGNHLVIDSKSSYVMSDFDPGFQS